MTSYYIIIRGNSDCEIVPKIVSLKILTVKKYANHVVVFKLGFPHTLKAVAELANRH